MPYTFATCGVFLFRRPMMGTRREYSKLLRLRYWRLSRGLSQAEAARQLGMSHLTLGYLENGRLAPGPRDRERLRSFFGEHSERMLEEVGDDLGVAP